MAGKTKLTGENLTAALKMLHDVTTILEARCIPYCLDGGTLLGIMRENRLLPWDNDLDLFVPAKEFKRVKAAMWKFRQKGYWSTVRKFRVDKPPCRTGAPRVVKVKTRKMLFFAGAINLDIFIKYKKGDKYYWIAGGRNKNVQKSIPAKYYEQLTQIEFENKLYWIPENYDEYLTLRFGDWKVPVKKWNNLEDDQAIID